MRITAQPRRTKEMEIVNSSMSNIPTQMPTPNHLVVNEKRTVRVILSQALKEEGKLNDRNLLKLVGLILLAIDYKVTPKVLRT